jgi:K+-transporting ATPase KdpF subunit
MAARGFAGCPVIDMLWLLAVSALLTGYLLFALLAPEKF